MIITLIVAVLMSLLALWFVLAPLLSAQNFEAFSASYKGFADEAELARVMSLRDQLLNRLVTGQSQDAQVERLSETECFQILTSICLRLRRAELPYLSGLPAPQATDPQSGSVRLDCAVLVGFAVLLSVLFISGGARAQSQPSASSEARQSQSLPPALALLEPGVYAPQSNRYMVAPALGHVIGHHLSSFVIPTHESADVLVVLPLPAEISDWQIASVRPEGLGQKLGFTVWQGTPALKIPAGSQGLLVELSSEFKLDAFTGRARWQNNALGQLPGEQILVLFSSEGIVHTLLKGMIGETNIWPPRIGPTGDGVDVQERTLQMDPSRPARKVQIVSRTSGQNQPFLNFEIVGVTPSRLPLKLLGGWVGALLLGTAAWIAFRGGRWRIDGQRSLPG
jgi:hypothetical protein